MKYNNHYFGIMLVLLSLVCTYVAQAAEAAPDAKRRRLNDNIKVFLDFNGPLGEIFTSNSEYIRYLSRSDLDNLMVVCKNINTALSMDCQVDFIIANRENINLRNGLGKTPLFYAAENNNTLLAKKCIEYGAYLDIQHNDRKMPLELAPPRSECQKYLLACENLIYCTLDRDLAGVNAALAAKASVNVKDQFGITALAIASDKKDSNIVRVLLGDHNIDVNSQDKAGHTALLRAVDESSDIVQALLAVPGIDVNLPNKNGLSPLMAATHSRQLHNVRALLAIFGIDVNRQFENGDTALIRATYYQDLEIVQALLAVHGIKVNMSNSDGNTALMIAATNEDIELAQDLITSGAYIDIKNNAEQTAAQIAPEGSECRSYLEKSEAFIWDAKLRELDKINTALAEGISVNVQNNNGLAALHYVAFHGLHEVLPTLLAALDINVNLRNKRGQTALMLAAKNGQIEIIQALLAVVGLDVEMRDENGKTAMKIAADNKHQAIVDALLRAGASNTIL